MFVYRYLQFVEKTLENNSHGISKEKYNLNTYNFRLNYPTSGDLLQQTRMIFEEQEKSFKLNVGLGFFLRNIETCELRYYYASNNSKLFTEPFLVTNASSFKAFLDVLMVQDLYIGTCAVAQT